MKRTVKVFASILAIVLLMSTISVAFSAYAVDGNIIGDYSFTVVDNPYENIDWDSETLHAFKSSTHAHTVRSDADIELDDTIWYHYQKGYELLCLTDHGTVNGVEIKFNGNIVGATEANGVNCGWTRDQDRCAVYGYQYFVHGDIDEILDSDYINIINGANVGSRPTTLVEAKRGMFNMPLGNEANGISSNKCHVNLYGRSYSHGSTRADTYPTNIVKESYNNGSFSRINHVGEWAGGNDDPGVYNASWVNDFVAIFQQYCPNRNYSESEKSTWESYDYATGEVFKRGVIGIELVNTSDNRTKNDRELVYDASLKILAPQGINMYGFCEDDSHEESDVDRNAQYFLVNDGTASSPADEAYYDSVYGEGASYGYTGDIRNSMTNGEFFASSKNSKRTYELGDGFSATGDYPGINNFEIDTETNQLIIGVNNANKARIVADAKILDTKNLNQSADYQTVVFDLNAYESQINSYVRLYFTGDGGITYMQPILLSKTESDVSTVQFNVPSLDTTLNVYNEQGSLINPENTDLVYVLDAGNYTYIASRPGYITTDPIPFTVSQADIDGAVKKVIDVTLEENSEVVFTNFYVPETIYMNTSDLSSFQYYVDRANTPGGALNSGISTTGNVYFSRKDSSNISISYKVITGADSADITLTSSTAEGSELSAQITSGILSSAVSNVTHGLIEWTATYTYNGEEFKSTAYSYLYAPLSGAGSVAAAGGYAETSKNIVSWSHTTMHVTGTVWLAGVHSVSGGSSAYKFSPYGGNAITETSGTGNITTSGIGMSTASDDSSGGSKTVSPSGTSGTLTIDTSRYNNLNQIPNLSVGLDCNDATQCTGVDADETENYVMFDSTKIYSQSIDVLNNYSGQRLFMSDNTNADTDIDYAINTSVPSITVSGRVSGAKESRYDTIEGTITLNLTYVNKNALRQQIETEVKNAYQSTWFVSQVDFNAYMQAIKVAYIVLGNPTSTADEITQASANLSEAAKNPQLKSGNAVVKFIDNEGNILKTDNITYLLGETLIVSSEEFYGYTYANRWEYVLGSNIVKNGTATYGGIMATSESCQWNFYYDADTYNVSFDAGYDSYVPDNGSITSIKFNKNLSLPSNKPSREGYTFTGWHFDVDDKIYPAGSAIKWTFDQDGSFTAVYTGNEYTLNYDSNGGTILGETSFKGTFGDFFDVSTEVPVKTGNTFTGWELLTPKNDSLGIYTPGGRFNWGYPGNLTLCAKWDVIYINVSFETNGGELDTTSISVPYGEAYGTLPTPTKFGYKFAGWYSDAGLTKSITETSIMNSVEGVTLYAKWVEGRYDVIYYVDGVEYTRSTFGYGDKIVLIPTPSKTGHTFSGWSEVPETMPAEDIIVSGTFTAKLYTISYVVDDYVYKSQQLTYGTPITPPAAPEITGYTFTGWTGVPETMPTRDVTVTGTYTVNSHYVIYYLDGEEYSKELYDYGTKLQLLENPTKSGYSFSGWSILPETMPDNDVLVYGTFTGVAYTVSYYVDGVFYTSQNYALGDTIIPAEAPTKKGYTFSGWTGVPETMPEQNITVNGTFIPDMYTITYKVDGEVYTIQEVPYNSSIVLIDEPTKEGHTFSGWSTVPATMPLRNLTVNGLFTANTYTYKFVLNGTEVSNWTITAKYGTAITAPVPEVEDGYVFSGWSPAVPNTMGAESTTFYGITSKDLVIYSFDINGGFGASPESQRYTIGQVVALPDSSAFAKTGYTFSGWSENKNAGAGVFTTTVGDSSITMYAVWTMMSVYIEPVENTTTVIDEINDLIYGVKENITENEFETQYVEIVGENGNIQYEKGISLGTGSKIILKNTESSDVVATYTLVVYGDVDGDGIADGRDVILATMLKDKILTKADVGAAIFEAADCNHDGVITDSDITEIINSGTMSFDIIQTK